MPELPLARTQNFTIVLLPELSEYTESCGNRIGEYCFGYWIATVTPAWLDFVPTWITRMALPDGAESGMVTLT